MRRLNTVNVIDFADLADVAIRGLRSYPDTAEGNKAAEEVFREWVEQVVEAPLSEEDMQCYIEDGICTIGEGAVLIVHSQG